ncbi:tetratricopeptide repeat protein [Pseudokordiimonas caeni]|uniref:tetratricopeptide repeat protein n=1 Tax=Pseudokordiimonas caeni TaxID=2997908 RepID=UPI00281152D4|nr:tetratricopeptide repeat protein [Pseudokordiimonas caeni]
MADLIDIKQAVREFLDLGRRQAGAGQIEEAERTLRAVIALDRKSPEAWHMLGEVLSALPGRRGEAAEAFSEAMKLEPTNQGARESRAALGFRPTVQPTRDRPERNLVLPQLAGEDGKEALIAAARAAETNGDFLAAQGHWERVIAIDPSDTWAWTQHAHNLSVNLQDFEGAEAAYRRAVDEDPFDDWAWGKLGIMLADFLGRVEEGQSLLRHAISLDGSEPYYHGWLGWTLYRQSEDLDASEASLMEAVRIWPDYQWAWFHLGYVRYLMGDKASEAEEAFLKALELEPADVPALFNLASLYEEQMAKPRRALQYFQKVLAVEAGDPATLRRMAMLWQGPLGDPKKAEAAYREVLVEVPDDYDVLTRLGWLLWEHMDKADEGIKLLEEAARVAPDNAWVLTHVAQAWHMAKGDSARAVDWVAEALKVDPAFDWANAYMGLILAENTETRAAAEVCFKRAVTISPDYSWAWHQLARYYLGEDATAHLAWEPLSKVLEFAPNHVSALYDIVWLGLYHLHRADIVADEAARLIELDEESGYALSMAGRVLRLTGGDEADIETLLRRAVNVAPDDHFAWHELGEFLLYDVADLEAAEESLLRAQQLDASCKSIDLDLGLIRLVQGRTRAAREHFERALEIDPDNGAAWAAYARFLYLTDADRGLVEQAFDRALQLEPDFFEGWALYAGYLAALEGHEKEAEEALERARTLAPATLDLHKWIERQVRPLVLDL